MNETFDVLPSVESLRLRFHARSRMLLPPLITNPLRGAFGRALRGMTCLATFETNCRTCQHARGCAYALLFEPPGGNGSGEGVTDRAPPPVVFGPEAAVTGHAPLLLEAGDGVTIRVSLIGKLAAAHEALVIIALRKAAEGGIGRAPDGGDGDRVPLYFEGLERSAPLAMSARHAAELDFVSPVRLKEGGKVAASVTASALTSAILRRADILSRLYGGGALELEDTAPELRVRSSSLRIVGVTRYSSRQHQRMELPGLMGSVVVEGNLAAMWPAVLLGERVQIGKGTSFGFGRFRVVGVK